MATKIKSCHGITNELFSNTETVPYYCHNRVESCIECSLHTKGTANKNNNARSSNVDEIIVACFNGRRRTHISK